MKIKVISIGNSKGVRLPNAVLKQYKIGGELSLELHEDGIMLLPASKVREGWDEQFKKANVTSSAEEKQWINLENSFDEEEWTW